MSQLEGSLALGRAPASNGSPGAARARWAVGLLIVLALLAIALPADATQPALPAAAERRAANAYAKLPLAFIPNAGQTDERVRYYAQGAGYGLYFTDRKAVLALEKGDRGHALELRFLGANPNAEPEAADRGTGRVNYLTGSEHQTDLPTYGRLVYRDLWPGIDMVFEGEGGKLRYEFRLRPGARPPTSASPTPAPRTSRWRGRGALDRYPARHPARRAPAELPAHRRPPRPGREPLCARRRLLRVFGRTTRPKPAAGDRSQPRLLHLPGRVRPRRGLEIAVDSAGAAYVTGEHQLHGLPDHRGGLRHQRQRHGDAFVTKLNPAGSGLAYSTYLGGSPRRRPSGSRSTRRGPPTSPGSPLRGLPDHRGGLRHERQRRRRRVRHQAQSRRLGPCLLHLPGRGRL